MSRPAPPSGAEPPHTAGRADGSTTELDPIAQVVCRRYFEEFPDDVERYGDAGAAWCVHDSLYLLAWAIADHDFGDLSLDDQVRWLADVLAARSFPVERLARHLELVADGLGEEGPGRLLRDAAASLR